MQWLIDLIAAKVIATIGVPPCFVDRGDYNGSDFNETVITQDSSWHALDLSSIVPEGARGVLVHLKTNSTFVGIYTRFRATGQINSTFRCANRQQVSNIVTSNYLLLGVDANRSVDYYISLPGYSAWNLTVRGWLF